MASEPVIAVEYPLHKKKDMFCWGSTIHGELGLGGIEDENILIPRELDFKKAAEIQQSKLTYRIIHLYINIYTYIHFILLFIFLNNFSL